VFSLASLLVSSFSDYYPSNKQMQQMKSCSHARTMK